MAVIAYDVMICVNFITTKETCEVKSFVTLMIFGVNDFCDVTVKRL